MIYSKYISNRTEVFPMQLKKIIREKFKSNYYKLINVKKILIIKSRCIITGYVYTFNKKISSHLLHKYERILNMKFRYSKYLEMSSQSKNSFPSYFI